MAANALSSMDFPMVGLEPVSVDGWRLALSMFGGLLIVMVVMYIPSRANCGAKPTIRLTSPHDRRKIRRLVLPSHSVGRIPSTQSETVDPPRVRRLRERILDPCKPRRTFPQSVDWNEIEIKRDVQSSATDRTPLLVFVNSRSGGRQGVELLEELRIYLHSLQIVDLRYEGPESALRWWSATGLRYRVLVCGGDGTVGWVLEVLEQLQQDYVPPVAILPLGTGNDLSRVLGWGGGFTSRSLLLEVLQQVGEAHVALLDRWAVVCRDAVPTRRPSFLPAPQVQLQQERSMCNYLGIGVDAAVALDFHEMRERRPDLFISQLVNKLWYLRWGTLHCVRGSCMDIAKKMTLECDGVDVDIPMDLEGIVVLNISSFGGGSNLWGLDLDANNETDSDDEGTGVELPSCLQQARPSMHDGRLEVVGVHGSFHLGAAQVGLYSARRLAQASQVRITTKVALPVEVDGEPWWFAKDGEITIKFKSQAFMLARSQESSQRVATDVVEWALQRNIIDTRQRNELMKEIARRARRTSPYTSFSNLLSMR